MIQINGMAHVILTVSRFDLARAFYAKLLPQLGMEPVYDGEKFFYCVGARTAIGLEPVFAGDAGASGTVDALLPLWFAMVQHNGGNRRVALRLSGR